MDNINEIKLNYYWVGPNFSFKKCNLLTKVGVCWFKRDENPETFILRHINEMKRIKVARKQEFENYRKEKEEEKKEQKPKANTEKKTESN